MSSIPFRSRPRTARAAISVWRSAQRSARASQNIKRCICVPQAPLREAEAKNWSYFEALPSVDRTRLSHNQVKDVQLLDPLFEFSGACAGCGETPYIKLLTQLFGDRLFIANATGCSSIYGGSLPTTPYSVNKSGRGPTWSNSLFEDNAEFGLGIRLALDQQKAYAEASDQTHGRSPRR